MEDVLLALGVDADELSGLSNEQRLFKLTDRAEAAYVSYVQTQNDTSSVTNTVSEREVGIEELEGEIADLGGEIEILQAM